MKIESIFREAYQGKNRGTKPSCRGEFHATEFGFKQGMDKIERGDYFLY
jgi:hypothetical protein